MLANLVALLAAATGATGAVLGLAKGAGRLQRWHSKPDDLGWMVSMPVGGFPWQIASTLARAFGAFGAARAIFALFAVRPTSSFAIGVMLMLLTWDAFTLRFVSRPPLSQSPALMSALRLKAGAGLVASALAAFIFVRS